MLLSENGDKCTLTPFFSIFLSYDSKFICIVLDLRRYRETYILDVQIVPADSHGVRDIRIVLCFRLHERGLFRVRVQLKIEICSTNVQTDIAERALHVIAEVAINAVRHFLLVSLEPADRKA